MSLSSLLLNGANKDDSLDALFASNSAAPKPVGKPITIPSNSPVQQRGQKRKYTTENTPTAISQPNIKRTHPKPAKRQKSVVLKSAKPTVKPVSEPGDMEDDDDGEGDDEDENNAMLEDNYLTRRSAVGAAKSADRETIDSSSSEVDRNEDESEDDSGDSPPAHETSTAARSRIRQKPAKKTKYVPPDETPAQRAARTIFIGNIPIVVAKSKSAQKALKRHFTTLVPGAKIESMRFRSIAFATPTAPEESSAPSNKEKRQAERIANWQNTGVGESDAKGKGRRQTQEETSDKEGQSKRPAHETLTPAQRKRVAFFKGEFHDAKDSINAYIVFAHSVPSDADPPAASASASSPAEGQPATMTPVKSPSNLDPVEAARLAVLRCDGTTFLDHTIRVDRVGALRIKTEGTPTEPQITREPRATIFVGNLDFATKEEELRVWFEGVVTKERGPPLAGDNSDADVEMENNGKPTWVRSVRIVRDRDTQLGKGFAYVRFADRECVDELLNLDASTLKFAKRTLRIQRYKGIPGATPKSTASHNKSEKSIHSPGRGRSKPQADAKSKVKRVSIPIPKGDPSLGSRLAGLSKDERKAAKAANADRVQRRLAKKQAKGVAKSGIERAEKGRERKRERKGASGNGNKGLKARVGRKSKAKERVRSERSVEKRNAKK